MSRVAVLRSLNQEGLSRLVSREIIALVVKEFCSSDLAQQMSEWFATHPSRENYKYSNAAGELRESDTDRVGIPLSTCYPFIFADNANEHCSESWLSAYSTQGAKMLASIRDLCSPRTPPIDKLRLMLDELWPTGAHIARFNDLQPYVGVARIVSCETPRPEEVDPHLDWLPNQIRSLEQQFSAIVYLEMPPTGGEIEVWDISQEAVLKLIGSSTGMRRNLLPCPTKIMPERGDLIVINTRYPHAVASFSTGRRVVQTCFIGLNIHQPLLLWS